MTKFFNRNRMLIILFGIIILIAWIGLSLTERKHTTKTDQFTGNVVATTQEAVHAASGIHDKIFSYFYGLVGAFEAYKK